MVSETGFIWKAFLFGNCVLLVLHSTETPHKKSLTLDTVFLLSGKKVSFQEVSKRGKTDASRSTHCFKKPSKLSRKVYASTIWIKYADISGGKNRSNIDNNEKLTNELDYGLRATRLAIIIFIDGLIASSYVSLGFRPVNGWHRIANGKHACNHWWHVLKVIDSVLLSCRTADEPKEQN